MSQEAPALHAGVESNSGDRVLGEAGKDSFIALPNKGRLLPLKTMSQHKKN